MTAHDGAASGGKNPPSPKGYEILEELARGATGVVCKARQLRLNRLVAIKFLRADMEIDDELLARFRTEADAQAKFQHPNIVSIIDRGVVKGQRFLVQEYVDGGSLAEKLRENPAQQWLAERDAARLVQTLAMAIHAAHERGIVHRDLKPHNVLLTKEGIPKITDFGLAKRMDGPTHKGMTQTGDILGTAYYMAPEQAIGDNEKVGPAADVHALGAILFELITGARAFPGGTLLEILARTIEQDPLSPRSLRNNISRDLETICLKCLRKQPTERYGSAKALGEDIERWLTGQPIRARPVGVAERCARHVKRHRPAYTAAAVVLLLALLAGVAFGVYRHRLALDHAARQVSLLQESDLAGAPARLGELKALNSGRVIPLLEDRLRSLVVNSTPEHSREVVRLRLALLALSEDPRAAAKQAEAFLAMLDRIDPDELVLALGWVKEHVTDDQKRQMWKQMESRNGETRFLLNLACVLAASDASAPSWKSHAEAVTEWLVRQDTLSIKTYANAFAPVSDSLRDPLVRQFTAAENDAGVRLVTAEILSMYCADDQPSVLADLILDAEPAQHSVLFRSLRPNPELVVERMGRELDLLGAKPAEDVPRKEREHRARRFANAAVTLLKMDAPSDAWKVFGQSQDPEARAQLIWRSGLLQVDPNLLVQRLDEEPDAHERQALIIALGEFTRKQLPDNVREPLVEKLLKWYREDPDPGIHGAIGWLLRHAKEGSANRPLDWGQAEHLNHIDKELMLRDREVALSGIRPPENRRWYVNGQGQTMVLAGPGEFQMGSRPSETDRNVTNAGRHLRGIGRTFAIAAHPVTVEQFKVFLTKRNIRNFPDFSGYSPDPQCPIIYVTWYQAAQYCNWLSEMEGLDEKVWCYPKDEDIKAGMKPYPDYLKRKGYRLPTEAEWEYAVRGKTDTIRFYGSALELLPRYAFYDSRPANYNENAPDRTWPVGQKRPNDLGLFDMGGNAWNWTQDPYLDYPQGDPSNPNRAIDDVENELEIGDSPPRVLRGTSCYGRPPDVCSAYRRETRPSDNTRPVGLRPARTLD